MLGATIQDLPLASALEIRSSMAKAPWINRFSEPRGRPCPWRWPWSCECRWLKLHRSINARSHDPGIVLGAGPGNAKPLGVIDARGPLALVLELRSSMTAMKVALLPCFGVLSAICSHAEARQRTFSAEGFGALGLGVLCQTCPEYRQATHEARTTNPNVASY